MITEAECKCVLCDHVWHEGLPLKLIKYECPNCGKSMIEVVDFRRVR